MTASGGTPTFLPGPLSITSEQSPATRLEIKQTV